MERLFDLRFVIGAFFTIAGILLLVYGFVEGAAINRNCGALFVLFEVMVLRLKTKLGVPLEDMRSRHTNME